MEKKAYHFEEQLQKAHPDEQMAVQILCKNPRFLGFTHQTGREARADAFNKATDEWLEIKVDYTQYPNHFVERFSVKHQQLPGGPWQYLARGVRYYCFYYKKLKTIYVFETATLVNRVETLLNSKVITDTANGRDVQQAGREYVTYGYKVPKSLLDDSCIYHEQATD